MQSADRSSRRLMSSRCCEMESICHICMKLIKGHGSLLKHVQSHDDRGCETEEYQSLKLDRKAKKEASGVDQKERMCPFCGEDIGNDGVDFEKHLQKHAFSDSSGTRFPCIICGKPFKSRCDLRRHLVRHTDIKPFKCTYCVKTFVTKNATFTTSSSRRKHRNKHTGESRHICHICSKKYFDSYALNRHIMMHTGERPFRCNVCNRGFCQRGDMRVHMQTHINDRPFECRICSLRFRQSSNRNAHMRRHVADIH